jgi:hypothetical protein
VYTQKVIMVQYFPRTIVHRIKQFCTEIIGLATEPFELSDRHNIGDVAGVRDDVAKSLRITSLGTLDPMFRKN